MGKKSKNIVIWTQGGELPSEDRYDLPPRQADEPSAQLISTSSYEDPAGDRYLDVSDSISSRRAAFG